MRFWPRSIAGRAALVLIGGLLIVLWAGSMVWWVSVAESGGPPDAQISFESVASVAAIVDHLPPEQRTAALNAAASEDFKLDWSPDRPAERLRSYSWGPRWLADSLRRAMAARGLDTVEIGFLGHDGGPGPAIATRVRLSDGSWLQIAATGRLHTPPKLIAFLGTVAVVALGLTGLAILVSRKVTAPLGRFSAAAARLGTDVDAPPLEEKGPTEIREAAEAFNQMQRRIRRFVEDRTQMLAAISHDLRTMLTRLRLRADYIDDPEQQAKALADLAEMQQMLDASLSLARNDAASEPSTTADLASLLQTLCDDLADAGQTVACETPQRATLACRPNALRRALANLIDNAVKYGGGAQVTLTDRPDAIEIRIADNGPGIPEPEREKVFAPFYRIEGSRSRETGGTGLGLALARNIVRGHGGDIVLEAREPRGLVARVTLPRSTPA